MQRRNLSGWFSLFGAGLDFPKRGSKPFPGKRIGLSQRQQRKRARWQSQQRQRRLLRAKRKGAA